MDSFILCGLSVIFATTFVFCILGMGLGILIESAIKKTLRN